ncbi:hypothetical protein [Hydrogenophaga sp. IBVHS2]|uniref:hypothetical protein n=1 Tax=Hydrogenophaga sp. IBVHS2 TaxID=1985170 RepID=UPI0015C51DF2|nr:hypothetical protein [Hydrogenophaga sp. IBVHS2]
MTARFACQSTVSTSKTGRLTATVTFLDNTNAGIGTYLKLTTGAQLIGYTFNRTTGSPVAPTASTTFPSCDGTAPSQPSNGIITLFSNFNVTGPASFGTQDYFLNFCVRIPATAAGVGTYVGKLQLATSGTITSGGGSFQATTNANALVMTATVPTNCTIGTLTDPSFEYTSFTTTDSTFFKQLTTVSCNSGSWTIDIRDSGATAVTTPLTGSVRGVQYALGLSNSSTVPVSGLSAVYPNTGTGQTQTAPLNLQLGVQTACLIDKPIDSLTVSYTSFQPNAVTASVPVLVRCNANTPWTAGLQGPAAPTAPPVTSLNSQSLLGLTYSLQVTPASGTGLGNINNGQQTVTIGLNLPGGQGGRCATGSCTASATHTLVITY